MDTHDPLRYHQCEEGVSIKSFLYSQPKICPTKYLRALIVRDQGVGGSSPLAPTNRCNRLPRAPGFLSHNAVDDFAHGRVDLLREN